MSASGAPLVSVMMPVHNGQAHLGEAVASVLGQSLGDLELVLVDDASTDGSRALAEAEAARDPRVRVQSGRGLGISAASNQGLAACRGGFIALMDQDDLSRPKRLELQAAFLRSHPDVGVVGGQIHRFGLEGLGQGGHPRSHADIQAAAIFVCPVHGGAAMVRRSALEGLAGPFEPAEDFSQDYGLWTRLLFAGVRFANLAETVLDYRMHAAQASAVHTARQAAVSSGIRAKWLARLGLDPGPAELDLHSAAAEGRWPRDLDGLRALERWYLKLRAAGRAADWLEPAAFDRALARRWTAALWARRGAGLALYRLASASPLGRLPDPEFWKPWAARAGAFLPSRKA